MRKIIICLLMLFILTGCQSKDEYFTKTCETKVKSETLNIKETKEITYNNKDEVTRVIISRSYIDKNNKSSVSSIKKAATDYNNELAEASAIKIRVLTDSDDEYKIQYDLDVQKLDSLQLEMFGLDKNAIKYFKKLKKDGIECK